jgi:hypothetical protein
MARPKKHHYITKAYLDGFLEPGETQLFCRMRHKEAGWRAAPDEIAFQKNYYSFKRKDGTWNDGAERFFADKIETPGLAILKKLVNGDTRLKWDERTQFAMAGGTPYTLLNDFEFVFSLRGAASLRFSGCGF